MGYHTCTKPLHQIHMRHKGCQRSGVPASSGGLQQLCQCWCWHLHRTSVFRWFVASKPRSTNPPLLTLLCIRVNPWSILKLYVAAPPEPTASPGSWLTRSTLGPQMVIEESSSRGGSASFGHKVEKFQLKVDERGRLCGCSSIFGRSCTSSCTVAPSIPMISKELFDTGRFPLIQWLWSMYRVWDRNQIDCWLLSFFHFAAAYWPTDKSNGLQLQLPHVFLGMFG